jgi:hypothetical protein
MFEQEAWRALSSSEGENFSRFVRGVWCVVCGVWLLFTSVTASIDDHGPLPRPRFTPKPE